MTLQSWRERVVVHAMEATRNNGILSPAVNVTSATKDERVENGR